MSDSKTSCQYCSIELTKQYEVDSHIANGDCLVKQPTEYEKELLQRVMDQEVLIQSLNLGMKKMITEAVKKALNRQVSQTTNYNLNIICLDKNSNLVGVSSLLESSETKLNALTYVEEETKN